MHVQCCGMGVCVALCHAFAGFQLDKWDVVQWRQGSRKSKSVFASPHLNQRLKACRQENESHLPVGPYSRRVDTLVHYTSVGVRDEGRSRQIKLRVLSNASKKRKHTQYLGRAV
eukprot:1138569-Pelagomonas_calceolata.AAC.5